MYGRFLSSELTPKLVSLPRRVRPLSQQTLWVFCLSGSCEAWLLATSKEQDTLRHDKSGGIPSLVQKWGILRAS